MGIDNSKGLVEWSLRSNAARDGKADLLSSGMKEAAVEPSSPKAAAECSSPPVQLNLVVGDGYEGFNLEHHMMQFILVRPWKKSHRPSCDS